MKKFTLLILALLMALGGRVKAQPSSLEGVNATLKASGDYLKSVYTQANGWATDIPEGDRKATPVTIDNSASVLKGAVGGDNLLKFFDTGGNFEMALMDKLHLDIYPTVLNEDGKLGVFFYSRAISNWTGAEINVTANQWNSIDIDLSDYKATTLSPISAFAISGGVGNKDAGTDFVKFADNAEVYIANAYFYNEGTSPKVSATLVSRNHKSVTFNVKGLKTKEATALKYIVKYGEITKEFTETGNITVDNLTPQTNYTFEISVNDGTNNTSNTVTISTNTLEEPAAEPTSVPALVSNATHNLYVKGEKSNGFDFYNWGGVQKGPNTGEKGINGTEKAFFIENHEWYGSGFDKVDATGMMLHVDVYPLHTDVPLSIVPITNNGNGQKELNGQDFKLKKGEWNGIDIDMDGYPKESNITDLFQIKFIKSSENGQVNADGTQSFYIGNVYLYVKNDGENPVILRSLIAGKTVASATLRLQAKDNSGKVSFKVDIKKDDQIVQTIDNIKAKSEEFVRLIIHDLEINTKYTGIVTVTDRSGNEATATIKGIGGNDDFFVTEALPLAVQQKPTATEYYYLHGTKTLDDGTKSLRGRLNKDGWDQTEKAINEIETGIGENKVAKHTFTEDDNVFGLCLTGSDEDKFAGDKNSIARIAIYPVEFEDIEVAPRYYNEQDKFEPRKLKTNQWNYITVAPHSYAHTGHFMGLVFKAPAGSRVFVDNFCRYTSSDTKAPTITNFQIVDRKAESVEVSFDLSDEVGEGEDKTSLIKYEIYAKKADEEGDGKIIGSGSTENPSSVKYYAQGLKGNTDYLIYVMAKDKAENRSNSENIESNFKYENEISLNDVEVSDVEKGGKVVIKPGKWNIEEFNKIAAEYPYGCFDLRNVIFPENYSDKPEDKGKDYAMNFDANDDGHGLRLFNHNAYIIVDRFNSVNSNYVVPMEDGKLLGLNFNWFDGDFTIGDGPNRDLESYYNDIVAKYKEKHNTATYPGLTRFGYIKCDPYTGETVYFKEQGAAMTRQMFTGNAVDNNEDAGYEKDQKANFYSTIICPFPLNTENITRCDFYQLMAPTYDVDTKVIKLNFAKMEGQTTANTPYLIKVKDEAGGSILFADAPENTEKKLSFDGINYDNTFGKNLISSGKTNSSDGKITVALYGTYTSQDLENRSDTKFYGLKQGNGEDLTLVTANKIDFPAFRAMVALSGDALTEAKQFNLSFDGEVTGITNVSNNAIPAVFNNVYSIDGKKVGNSRNGLINLPAGLYIVNGKKVVIK